MVWAPAASTTSIFVIHGSIVPWLSIPHSHPPSGTLTYIHLCLLTAIQARNFAPGNHYITKTSKLTVAKLTVWLTAHTPVHSFLSFLLFSFSFFSSMWIMNTHLHKRKNWSESGHTSGYYERFYDYQVSPDDTTVTLQTTEAFASALRTIGWLDNKWIILEPFHELYPSHQCHIFYQLPHNRTGKVFCRGEELKQIVQLCLKHNVYIKYEWNLWAHVFHRTTQDYLLPKEFPEIVNPTLVCNSIGQFTWLIGWRLGCWCLHPPHIRDTYRVNHHQMALPSLSMIRSLTTWS